MENEQEKVFHGQWDKERVILIIHKHWMAYITTIFLMTIIFLFTLFFYIIFHFLINVSSEVLRIFFLVSGILNLVVLAFGLASWIDYYFDVIIVTDQRLISIQQKGLFSRGIDSLTLLRIQNISAEARGVLQTMFNYGTAYIETAGEQGKEEIKDKIGNFSFDYIPDPYIFSEKVMELHDAVVANSVHKESFAVGEGDLKKEIAQDIGEKNTQDSQNKPEEKSQNQQKPESTMEQMAKDIEGEDSTNQDKNASDDAEDFKYPQEPDI